MTLFTFWAYIFLEYGDCEMSCIDILNKFGFETNADANTSVYFVRDLHTLITNPKINANILISLESAGKLGVDAVYFRFFDDGRPPLPQLYIFDDIANPKDSEFYTKKHKDIWSSCSVPAFIIVGKTTIRLYDACTPVKFKEDKMQSTPTSIIDLSDISSAIDKFNAASFNNGTFWEEQDRQNLFTSNKGASQRLIKGLKKIRQKFLQEDLLPNQLSDKLLIICILIKYLEETGVDEESHQNRACDFFLKETGCANLVEIITKGKIVPLLDALARHFNGGVFSFSEDEKLRINKADLSKLATFFEARYHDNLFGWREYSFEYIPIELISNFYEEFLDLNKKEVDREKKDTGVVYTPSFLVNLLIDELLPLSKDTPTDIKLIDPACGSGIFLATAFRRLVQCWRIKNIAKGQQLGNTDPELLKRILTKNIFGVDINRNAVNLTIFSLQLALCSMLTPKQIWCELKFDNLLQQKNIRCDDFLLTINESRQQKDFDLVLGNPPYEQNKKNVISYNKILERGMDNPQGELSLLFLEKSMQILKPDGKLCFLLPSGPLLYNSHSLEFRTQFFTNYNVTQIIDLVYFRRILFEATVTTLALFVENAKPKDEAPIKHIVPKRTKVSKDKIFFEIDHYDFHAVPRSKVLADLSVWKSNILGGYLVYNIANKIANSFNIKIKDIPELKIFGSISGKLKNEYDSIQYDSRQKFFFNSDCSPKSTDRKLWCIKKSIKFDEKFPSEFDVDDKNNHAIGILAKEETINLLHRYLVKNSSLFRLLLAAQSNRQAIRSPYIIEAIDLKNLPYDADGTHIPKLLSYRDKIIIDDFVKYRLESLGNGEKAKINIRNVTEEQIVEYSDVLCRELNEFFKTETNEFSLRSVTFGPSFVYCKYELGAKTSKSILFNKTTKDISALLEYKSPSSSCRFGRIIRIYGKNEFTIIKPIKLRYWLKSTALYDVDEILKESIYG